MNGNLKFLDGTRVDPQYLAAVNRISQVIHACEDAVDIDELETYAASHRIEAIKPQKITFYFGDKPIGEVKFIKEGSKQEKVERCKKTLMKEELAKNPASNIGQLLYSQFCNFKIIG